MSKSNFQVFNSMVMARSHMESAAVVTYALEMLNRCVTLNNWQPFEDLIPQSFFGTAMINSDENYNLQSFLSSLNPETATPFLRIGDAISALDRYIEQNKGHPSEKFRLRYVTLCDYAHPTIHGSVIFSEAEEGQLGWEDVYSYWEVPRKLRVAELFNILLSNMRVGYASAILVADGSFEESNGQVVYHKPSTSALEQAEHILQMEE